MSTQGIGGSTIEAELEAIQPTAHLVNPIQKEEFQARIDKACQLMHEAKCTANVFTFRHNLFYFTGMKWNASERMVGAFCFQMEN